MSLHCTSIGFWRRFPVVSLHSRVCKLKSMNGRSEGSYNEVVWREGLPQNLRPSSFGVSLRPSSFGVSLRPSSFGASSKHEGKEIAVNRIESNWVINFLLLLSTVVLLVVNADLDVCGHCVVDGQLKCEKWLREDDSKPQDSKKSWWLNRSIGHSGEESLVWDYPFAEGRLFVLTISAGLEGFHLMIDGRHITSFPYRLVCL